MCKIVNEDIWNSGADVICVTTNGVVKQDGSLVMGKGIAKEAADKYPQLPAVLGKMVSNRGNIPAYVWIANQKFIASLPTKHDYRQKSDIALIVESVKTLSEDLGPNVKIAITKPGCANGKLNWEDVEAAIDPYLDDRFTVYDIPEAN